MIMRQPAEMTRGRRVERKRMQQPASAMRGRVGGATRGRMTPYKLTPSHRLHCEAKSGIMRQAGDNKEHLIVVRLQTESIGEVTAMDSSYRA